MFIYFEIQLLFMTESFAVSFKFMYLLIFGNLYSSCSFFYRMSKGMPISVRQWAIPWSNSGECAAICTKSNSALSPYRQVSVWVSLHNIEPHAKYSSDWSLSPLFHRFTVFSLLTQVWFTVHSVYFYPSICRTCLRPLLICFHIYSTLMYIMTHVSLTSMTHPSASKLPPSPSWPDRLL